MSFKALPAMSVKVLCLSLLLHVAHVACSDPVVFHVAEEQPSRTELGNIIDRANLRDVYAPDVIPDLRFRFRDTNSLFEIVEDTGVIRTRRVIDREQLPECMYSVSCSFSHEVKITPFEYFKLVEVLIHVDDINDHEPEFSQPRISLTISENAVVNTTFPLQSAEDPDSAQYGVSHYELVSPSDVFALNVNVLPDGTQDLMVRLLQPLDRERENLYSIQVRAVDGGSPPKSGTMVVDISVGDTNDNTPVFESRLYEAHIHENLEVNTPVVQVSAVDMDEGHNGEIVYEFDHITQTEFESFFGINEQTGFIYVTGEIDYETHKVFPLTVVAKDRGQSTVPDSTKVEIIVIDDNDNPPVISVNTFTNVDYARVPENVEAGHTIAYVGVSDPDTGPGGNITCGIDNGHFQIRGRPNSGSTGFEIVSAHPFDREQVDEYALLIHCEDQGSPQLTSSVRVTIKVTDENDNNPVFVPNSQVYTLSVPENNKVGDILMKVNATDADTMENAAIRYSLRPIDGTPEDVISIDLITGVIRADVVFDFETRDYYQFRIMATDQGSPSRVVNTLLTLNILDVNDGFPYFVKSAYEFTVMENQVANTRVGSISAVDEDATPFNRIIYSLEPGRDSYKFDIDPDSGELKTATIIDREEAPVYYLTGVATNEGAPEIRTTVNITVDIDDENDNPPTILFPTDTNNTVQVPTRMDVGYHVTQIEASDPDSLNNAQLKFSISSGNEGDIFNIDPDTGAISTAVATDMSNLKTQRLVIKVKDSGVPEKIMFTRLNVVFNSSVDVTSGMLGKDTITVLIVAAIAGCVAIVIVITIAICCIRRSKNKKNREEHVYNCRAEEAKKALANGDRPDSNNSSGDLDKSVDTGINKAKEKSKKEVTFSVDMDNGWPMQNEKAVIENPHAQHIDPSDCRPPPARVRSPALGEGDEGDGGGRPVSRQNSCCTCLRAPPLTQQNLDMLEYNLLWNREDRDSESGCSGTDSGRGPSEEGECAHHGDGQHGHDQCGHGTCCCSSGIYAKKFHPHLHPGSYNGNHGCHTGQRGCHCCGPAHACTTCSHGGHSCGGSCGGGQGVKRNTSHCSVDECTPLESLPPFGRPHYQSRMYPKTMRMGPDCHAARAARHRLALDPAEMAKHRHYGYAPSLPSLLDRHTPSPTFTTASDSQFYPYTGAHSPHGQQQNPRALYPGGKPAGNTAFHPIQAGRTPSPEDGQSIPGSMTMSDDGTTMSGSYSLDHMPQEADQAKSVRLGGGQVQDCFV